MTVSELENRVHSLEADVALLRARLERAEALAGIHRGLQAVVRGEYRDAREVLEELRVKHQIVRQ